MFLKVWPFNDMSLDVKFPRDIFMFCTQVHCLFKGSVTSFIDETWLLSISLSDISTPVKSLILDCI